MSKVKDHFVNDVYTENDHIMDGFDYNKREHDLWNAIAALNAVIGNEDQDTIPSQGLVFDCVKLQKTLKSFLNEYK